MSLLLLIIILVLVFGGGGGYYAHSNFGMPGLGGVRHRPDRARRIVVCWPIVVFGGADFERECRI